MIEILTVSTLLFLCVIVLIMIYLLRDNENRIKRAYKLIEAQERRDSEEANFGRASGLDLAMTMLEGEFEWLKRWYMD
jgi:hypothetical protein